MAGRINDEEPTAGSWRKEKKKKEKKKTREGEGEGREVERNTIFVNAQKLQHPRAMKKEIDAPQNFQEEWEKERRSMPLVQPSLLPS